MTDELSPTVHGQKTTREIVLNMVLFSFRHWSLFFSCEMLNIRVNRGPHLSLIPPPWTVKWCLGHHFWIFFIEPVSLLQLVGLTQGNHPERH